MIHFQGYDEVIKNIYDNNQEHIFLFWEELSDDEKKHLLDQVADINFTLLKELFSEKHGDSQVDFGPAPYIALPTTDEEMATYEEAKKIGEEYIKQGKVAAFLVADGQ